MKTVIILRGLPGCGKSSVAQLFGPHVLISMDKYWTRDGDPYKFDYTKLAEAVAWTHEQFMEALQAHEYKVNLIIVDNVSYAKHHYKFFQEEAEKAHARVHFIHVERPLNDLASHHNVPREKVFEMAARWERII